MNGNISGIMMRNSFITALLILFIQFNIEAQEYKFVDWSFQTNGNILSHPLVDDGIVYFGSTDSTFYAIDLDSHKAAWSFKASAKVQSQALAHEEIVYFNSGNEIYALNKKNGNKIWSKNFSTLREHGSLDLWNYHHGTPVISQSTIFFGLANGSFTGLDIKTGELISQFMAIDSAAIRCTPVVSDKIIYFGDWDGRIYAYDPNLEDTVWTYKTYLEQPYPTFGQINSELVVYDSVLVFGARNPDLQILDKRTGKLIWKYTSEEGGWISGDPVVKDDILYIGGSDNHKLFAFNVFTGSIYWEFEFLFNNFSKPIIHEDYILFTTGDAYTVYGSGKGHGYLYALNKKDGSLKNYILVGGNIHSSPVVTKDNILLASEDNHLYAISLHKFIHNQLVPNEIGYRAIENIDISNSSSNNLPRISYTVNYKTSVILKVKDLNGIEVRSLSSGVMETGTYTIEWDGKNYLGEIMQKGYYFIEIYSGISYMNMLFQKI